MNMDTSLVPGAARQTAPVYVIQAPGEQTVPFVFCSSPQDALVASFWGLDFFLGFADVCSVDDCSVDSVVFFLGFVAPAAPAAAPAVA